MIRIVLTVVILAGCGLKPRPQYSLTQDEQRSAAVKIMTRCATHGGVARASGSGVLYDAHRVITAYHVVACDGVLGLTVVYGDSEITADVSKPDQHGDIAILKLDAPIPARRLRVERMPDEGDSVCFEAVSPQVERSCGRIVGRHDRDNMDVLHKGITHLGNSGSGVYSRRGELVGIVVTQMRCGMNVQASWICGGGVTSLWRHREHLGI